MIVIGTDTHKRTHALAAVDEGTGRVRGHREIKADEPGHLAAVKWARGLDDERVWAIEDCRQVSRRLEQALLAAGERVVRVRAAPDGRLQARGARAGQVGSRSTRSRSPARSSRTASSASRPRIWTSRRWRSGCSPITATISSPSARASEPAAVASARALPRARGVAEARRARRRRAARPDRPAAARASARRPGQGRARAGRADPQPDPPGRTRSSDELLALIKAHRPQLLAETGCGALTAAILIGRTAGAERFQTDASFALQTGTAPIKCSSGQRQQHRLNRGGDRQLNHALHIIAITRAQPRPRHPRIPRPQTSRRQDHKGRAALPQAQPRHDASTTSSPSHPTPRRAITTRSPQRLETATHQSPAPLPDSCHA